MTLSEQKKQLRRELRAQLRAIPAEEKARLDEALLRAVLSHPWTAQADTVLLYSSVPPETDTIPLIQALLLQGKTVALPKCTAPGEMHFAVIPAYAPPHIASGAYAITEPTGEERPRLTERTLCIVPGVAFTPDGARLGQGGGFYDRFLAQHPALRTIALTYRRMLQEEIPCEAHDCRIQAVLTEQDLGG